MLWCGREVGGGEEVETLFPILYKVIKTNIEKSKEKDCQILPRQGNAVLNIFCL